MTLSPLKPLVRLSCLFLENLIKFFLYSSRFLVRRNIRLARINIGVLWLAERGSLGREGLKVLHRYWAHIVHLNGGIEAVGGVLGGGSDVGVGESGLVGLGAEGTYGRLVILIHGIYLII
jgi:hypothetical protein